jgi:hypothetical protein
MIYEQSRNISITNAIKLPLATQNTNSSEYVKTLLLDSRHDMKSWLKEIIFKEMQ